ncbi:MAG: hypothetical protein PF439_10885 [Helicobacteraceae bacterium]|nr:hypothetical protein [Helicobacteraceae bacterium]
MINKHILFAFGIALPLLAEAAGMGISIPFNITETERISYSNVNLEKTTYEYKPSRGLGFVFDTNIGKDKEFSYRLNLEYTLSDIDASSRLYSSSFSKHKYNIVNTFGFSVYHSRYVRFWVGPRLNFQYEHASSKSNIRKYNSYGIGLGVATGFNVHLGSKVSLGADIDYHGVSMIGGEDYRTYDGTTTGDVTHYTTLAGTNKGVLAHLYLLFRFGEHYEQNEAKQREESVIDNSL